MAKPFDKTFTKNVKVCVSTAAGDVPGSESKLAPLTPTIGQRTKAVLRGLLLTIQHHGASSEIQSELEKQVTLNLDTSNSEEVWLTRCKYLLTYFLAKYLRNPLPPKPDVPFVATGSLRRWIKARISAFNRKNTHLWYSWLQCKRCTLPLSEDQVFSSYQKHLETLTTPDCGDLNLIDEIFQDSTFCSILEDLSRKIKVAMDQDCSFTGYQSSGGASYESSRRDGGQYSTLFDYAFPDQEGYSSRKKRKNCAPKHLYKHPFTDDLLSMTFIPRLYKANRLIVNRVHEVRTPYGFEQWKSIEFHEEMILLLKEASYCSFLNACGIQEVFPKSSLPMCTVQGILEPNKCRIITKEQALLQYYNKPLQKNLHSLMRTIPCFRLIGRKICPTDLIDLTQKSRPSDQWFSIDYSNATDGLSYRYSGRVLREVIKYLPEDVQLLSNYSLGPHELCYPIKDSETGEVSVHRQGTMQNGQLMGGILSFLVLCLCNLGLYLRVTRDSQKYWSLQERINHVLVNGDDMVYTADPSLWEVHEQLGDKIGLKMSVGKAYCHPVYVNINSTSFHYDLRKVYLYYNEADDEYDDYEHWYDYPCFRFFSNLLDQEDYSMTTHELQLYIEDFDIPELSKRSNETPFQINYLNTGLFFGQHKVQGQVGGRDDDFIPYSMEDYKYYKGEISFADYRDLVSMGRQGQFSDHHRVLEGLTPFWNSKSIPDRALRILMRKAEVNSGKDYENLVSSLNVVLDGSLPGRASDILRKYLETHKENLRLETLGLRTFKGKLSFFTRNLFLPIHLGGMGVTCPSGFRFKIKKVQKQVLRSQLYKLSLGRNCELSSQLPLPGFEPTKWETVRMPWQRLIPERTIYECFSSDTYSLRGMDIRSFQGIPYSSCRSLTYSC